MEENEMEYQEARKETPEYRAIEAHGETLKIPGPVFAAVKEAQGWASGKKVEKAEFEKAVKDFLGSPIGGAG